MSPAIVHALRHRPILTKGGPVHVYVFVPGKDRAKALCREATDAIVAKIDGAEVVTRLARCKGTHDLPQGYSRQVRVPDTRVVGGLHAAASTLLRRVVAAGHAPCLKCVAENVWPVSLTDVTCRVESLVSEAVCSWLPLVLLGTPAAERHRGRNVFVEDAREYAGHLVTLRDGLPAADDESDWQDATTALHEAAHACYALATCEFANEGRNRLLAEAIRRALVVGALAKKLHGERYRVAVRDERCGERMDYDALLYLAALCDWEDGPAPVPPVVQERNHYRKVLTRIARGKSAARGIAAKALDFASRPLAHEAKKADG